MQAIGKESIRQTSPDRHQFAVSVCRMRLQSGQCAHDSACHVISGHVPGARGRTTCHPLSLGQECRPFGLLGT